MKQPFPCRLAHVHREEVEKERECVQEGNMSSKFLSFPPKSQNSNILM